MAWRVSQCLVVVRVFGRIKVDPQLARALNSPLFTTLPQTHLEKHIVQGHQPGEVEFPDGQKRSKNDLFQR